MQKKTVIPVVAVVIIVLSSTVYFEFFKNNTQNLKIIAGSGTIEVTEIQLSAKIAGRLDSVTVEEGSFVKKGDLLVELDYKELQAQFDSAKANLDYALQRFNRVKTLYAAGNLSTQEYETALSQYKVAVANYKLISANIQNAMIYSPLDGTVLEKNLQAGETAFPGSSILTIGDLKNPWMKIYVTEKELGKVKLGQEVKIRVDSFPEKRFSGRVVLISDKAEFTPKTIQTKEERVKLMYAVKIAMQNPGLELKPGMPADAEIEIGD
jgi:HlyD family secretion protein